MVGPTIPYGHAWHLKDGAGLLNLSRRVLADYVFKVFKGYGEDRKIKYAIIMNGHGGNIDALHDAAEHKYVDEEP